MARHIRVNTDLKPIREIDIENASKDELIEYLYQTIHNEVEKGEDADCDLIRECSDWLGELTADKVVFTPEELEAKLEALKNGKNIYLSHPYKTHSYQPFIKRKIFARVSILVASLVLLSFLSLSVVAMYAGYDSAWEYIVANITRILGLNIGDELNSDGITVIKYSESTYYTNMDEFLIQENMDILYPHAMPDNINITQIRIIHENDDRFTMYFTFSEGENSLHIANYYSSDPGTLDGFDCIVINNIDCYTKKISDNMYYSIFQYNEFEYTIQSPNYDDLLTIINNMKG